MTPNLVLRTETIENPVHFGGAFITNCKAPFRTNKIDELRIWEVTKRLHNLAQNILQLISPRKKRELLNFVGEALNFFCVIDGKSIEEILNAVK